MKIKHIGTALAAVLGLEIALSSAMAAGDALPDGLNGISNGSDVTTAVAKTVNAVTWFTRAEHVANGVALRNRTSGTIALRGIPASRAIAGAFLWWNVSDTNTVGATTSSVLFNGNAITGTRVADNADPCWGLAGNHTYRASVSAFIPSANPNQDYVVTVATSGNTTGDNPWTQSTGNQKWEGATLVVIYRSAATAANSAVIIYDNLGATEFSGVFTGTLIHPIPVLAGAGFYTMSGADGQRGAGHDNGSSNETGTFNGVQISGPPVAASDWDGSAGLPLTQLWDVHTHRVSNVSAGGSSIIGYNAPSDCLVPVVFVLQVPN